MGKVIFTEKSLEARTAADAVGRVLSGQADMQWCTDNGQLAVRGIWNRESDVLIHKPVALWRKMCGGYQPREGKDYEFQAAGVMSRPDVGCYGGDESDDETDAFYDAFDRDKDKEPESCPECGSGRIYCDDAGTNNIGHYGFYLCKECGHGWTIQFETDGTGIPPADESVTPPAADVTDTSWRAIDIHNWDDIPF